MTESDRLIRYNKIPSNRSEWEIAFSLIEQELTSYLESDDITSLIDILQFRLSSLYITGFSILHIGDDGGISGQLSTNQGSVYVKVIHNPGLELTKIFGIELYNLIYDHCVEDSLRKHSGLSKEYAAICDKLESKFVQAIQNQFLDPNTPLSTEKPWSTILSWDGPKNILNHGLIINEKNLISECFSRHNMKNDYAVFIKTIIKYMKANHSLIEQRILDYVRYFMLGEIKKLIEKAVSQGIDITESEINSMINEAKVKSVQES